MQCPRCGAESPDQARFCASCGQALQPAADERRVVTVLFADLVGFTSLSESLDPEQAKEFVDQVFERLVRDITTFGGQVDKIVGDAVVALFGAPVAHEDDAERAVRAGLRMLETLERHASERGVTIRMRVGVNTGEVLIGALRAGGSITAMGDVVNTASRLQTSAGPGELLVGRDTFRATRRSIAYEARGELVARGREQPVSTWAATATLAPPGYRPNRPRSPLVGRDAELGMLRHAIAAAITRKRGLQILLLGEAGVGKSRLAHELSALTQADHGALVLDGRCVPYGEANAFWPFGEALRHGCGIQADEPLASARQAATTTAASLLGAEPTSPEVGQLVNGLLHVMGYEGPLRDMDPQRARTESLQSLTRYLEASAAQRPVIMRLADLHWADDVILETLDALARQLARLPFVLVATARRSLTDRWSPRTGRHNTTVVNLDPLDHRSAAHLLDVLAPGELDPGTRRLLLDRSGGNPFFIEEMVALLAEAGPAVVAGAAVGDVPQALRGLVSARLDGLTAAERHLLEDAAVYGSHGTVVVLERMAEQLRGDAAVLDVLGQLVEKEVLTLDGQTWAFRSDLLREIAYTRLTKAERARRHFGIGNYMERRLGDRFVDDGVVDLLARHYGEAAVLVRELGAVDGIDRTTADAQALQWVTEAAHRAAATSLHPAAIRRFTQGLGLVGAGETKGEGTDQDTDQDTHHTDHERMWLLLGRSRSHSQLWATSPAREDAAAALDLAEALGHEEGQAVAHLRLGDAAVRDHRAAEADHHLQVALAQFEALGDQRSRAETLRTRGMGQLLQGEDEAAEASITAALEAFEALGDAGGRAWALQNLAWNAFSSGRNDLAEQRLYDSARVFEELGDPVGMSWAMGVLSYVRFHQGRYEESLALAEDILRNARERDDRWGIGMMLTVVGAVQLWSGRSEQAARTGAEAVEILAAVGESFGEGQARVVLGRSLLAVGQVENALDQYRLAAAASSARGGPRRRWSPELDAAVLLGDLSAARSLAGEMEAGAEPAGVGGAESLVSAGLALLQDGRVEAARPLLERAATRETGSATNANGLSALALCRWAEGRHADAAQVAQLVAKQQNATYADLALAGVAAGLSAASSGDAGGARAAFDSVRRVLAGARDDVCTAVARLAEAAAARTLELPDADTADAAAEASVEALGIAATGWRDLFDGDRGASRGGTTGAAPVVNA